MGVYSSLIISVQYTVADINPWSGSLHIYEIFGHDIKNVAYSALPVS